MATEVKRRRGTTTQHDSFTGAEGEITVDLTKDTLVVHDGSTQAGFPLLREDFSNAPAEIDVQNSTIEASEFIGDLRGAVRFKAKAVDTNISKGDAVYISGISGNTPTVGLADADNASKMPAFGLAAADINENATGEIITFGTLSGVDTSSFSVGDILYVDTSPSIGSTLTATAPAGESAQIQNIGKVQRSDATVGSIKVGGAGRSNATPNLNQDKIFLGDSNNRAVSTALSSIGLSSFNNDAGFVTTTGDNTFVTSASFNTGDGVLTLTRNDTNTVTADLDGRYLQLSGGTLTNSLTINVGSPQLILRDSTDDDDQSILFRTNGDVDLYSITGASDVLNIKTLTSRAMKFFTNDTLAMTIDTDGSIDTEQGLDVGGTLKLESVAQDTAATSALVWAYDGSQTVKYRTLGSNAFNSTTIPTNNNQLTNGAGYITQTDGDARYLQLTGGTISSNLIISGNLTVSGTTTTINTETINLADNIILLNSNFGGQTPTESAGIEIERGADNTNKQFLWNETNDRWQTDDALYVSGALTATGDLIIPEYIKHSGDTNTQIRFQSDDINLTAGGQNLVRVDYNSGGQSQVVINETGIDADFRVESDSNANALFVQGSSANVGIGATDPSEKLEISGTGELSAKINNTQYSRSFTLTQGGGYSHLKTSHSSGVAINYGEGNVGILSLFNNTTQAIKINANGDSYFNGGDVGIGATSITSGFKTEISGGFLRVGDTQGEDAVEMGWFASGNRGFIQVYDRGDSAFRDLLINDSLMIDTSGNVGIGTSSIDGTLHLDAGTSSDLVIEKDDGGYASVRFHNAGSQVSYIQLDASEDMIYYGGSGVNQIIYAGGSERLRIDSSGRIGVGVTPESSWTTWTPIQIGQASTFAGRISVNQTDVANNWYYDGAEKRINAGYAQRYVQDSSGDHYWLTAGTSTADSTITFNTPMIIKNSGNVGIGTTSPASELDVEGTIQANNLKLQNLSTGSSDTTVLTLDAGQNVNVRTLGSNAFDSTSYLPLTGGTLTGDLKINLNTNAQGNFVDNIGEVGSGNFCLQVSNSAENALKPLGFRAEKFIFATGNVGIGVTDPSVELEVGGSTNTQILISTTNNTGNSQLYFGDSDSDTAGVILYRHNGNSMAFEVNDAERMRIDSSGKLGIGTAVPDQLLHLQSTSPFLAISHTNDNGTSGILFRRTDNDQNRGTIVYDFANDAMTFRVSTNGTGEDMRLDSSGNLLVGKTSSGIATVGVELKSDGNLVATRQGVVASLNREDSDGDVLDIRKDTTTVGTLGNAGADLFINSSGSKLLFKVAGTTEATLNSNYLLVSTSNENVYNGTATGTAIGNGYIFSGRNGDAPLYLNRISTDGHIAQFRKNGSAVGSIGTLGGDFFIASTSGDDAGFRMDGSNNVIYASNSTGNARDNAIDLGASTVRWKDLYLGGDAYVDGDVQFGGNTLISTDTSDASDNAQIIISGGGASGDTRGASVHVSGNEHGNGGLLQLRAGSGSLSQIRSYTSGSERMRIDSSGTIKGIGTYTAGNSIKIFEAERSGGAVASNWSYDDATTDMSLGTSTAHRFSLKTSNTNRLTIDSSGNVGIGNTAPAQKLVVNGGIHAYGNITTPASGTYGLLMDYYLDTSRFWSRGTSGTNGRGAFSFNQLKADNTSQITSFALDTSGNASFNYDLQVDGDVLVGKTSAGLGTVGHEFDSLGYAYHTRNSEIALALNRKSTDGKILEFYKDTSTVGSIGTANGDLFIGTTNGSDQCYLRFAFGGVGMVPATSAGLANDNALDLGASNARFKDLYLGGDANIDGDVSMVDGNASGKFAVKSAGVHASYDLYNDGTSYFNGGVIVDAGFTQSGGAISSFSGAVNIAGKLTLDSGSLTNGIINTPASLRINIDSNNNNTGEKFVIGHNQDSINNNNELFVVNESGNVGIGASTADTKLHVEGVKNTSILRLTSTTNDASWTTGDKIGGIEFESRDGSGAGAGVKGSINYIVQGSTGSTTAMTFSTASGSSNNTERLRIDNNGNVGIGTDSPSYPLDILNNSTRFSFETSAGVARLLMDGANGDLSGGDYSSLTSDTSGNFFITTGNTERFRVEHGGNVGVGTDNPIAKFEVSDGSSSITLQDYNNGAAIFFDGSNGDFIGGDYFHIIADGVGYLGLGGYGGGATPLNINFQGNVGVGTNSPSAKLEVRSDGSAAAGAEIRLQHANNNSTDVVSTINFANNAGSVAMIQGGTTGANNTGYISFFTDNAGTSSEKMRIIANGNVGIGTSNPASMLNINTTGTANYGLKLSRNDSATDGFEFTYTPSSAEAFIENKYPTSSGQVYGDIRFRTNQGGTQTTSMTIKADGNYLQVSNGITFGSDTANANRLDDYEEGTFTPTIHAGATLATAHSNNYGKYTKIGNIVHCSGRLQTTSVTNRSSSTNVEIGGLPFSAVASGLSNGTGAIAGSIGFAGGFSGEAPTAMQIRQNEPNAFLYYQNASLSFSNLKGDDFSTGSNTIVFQITYQTS